MPENEDIQRLQSALESSEKTHSGPQGYFSSKLAFESGLERDYLAFRRTTNLPLVRAAIALSVLIYMGFLGSDALFFQRFQHAWIYAVIFIGCLPINSLLLGATYLPRCNHLVPHLTWMAALFNALSLSLIVAQGVKRGVEIPPEVLTLQLIYDFFLLGLAWRVATPIVVVSVLFFLATSYFAGMEKQALFLHTYFYAVAALLGSIGCYMAESAQRLAWIRARLLKELSEHDSLTGLYNRRVFFHRGDVLLRQCKRDQRVMAVLVLDVDHFKQFNDAHGHLAGDECLRRIAQAMQSCARRPLDVAARIGGEEFSLLFYDTSREAALVRAEQLREMIRGLGSGNDMRVTTSIGVAFNDLGQVENLQAMVGRADAALYRAKHGGRDRVCE